jgi:uncharacterized membrane protein YcjF (UPF0283 family)
MKRGSALLLGCCLLALPVEARAEEPAATQVPSIEFPLLVPAAAHASESAVLPVDDRVWREHRRNLRIGLAVGGVLVGAAGAGAIDASVRDIKKCHDWLGFCQAGDDFLAVGGGVIVASGVGLVIAAVGLSPSRQSSEFAPRATFEPGPGSGRLSVTF